MSLTAAMVRELIIQYVGADVGEVESARLLPLVEKQFERMQELRALDLGADDPRTMFYITDQRLTDQRFILSANPPMPGPSHE